MKNKIAIGGIGNYYGGMFIVEHDSCCFWIIENWDTDFEDINDWESIPRSLYNALLKFEISEEKRKQQQKPPSKPRLQDLEDALKEI